MLERGQIQGAVENAMGTGPMIIPYYVRYRSTHQTRLKAAKLRYSLAVSTHFFVKNFADVKFNCPPTGEGVPFWSDTVHLGSDLTMNAGGPHCGPRRHEYL